MDRDTLVKFRESGYSTLQIAMELGRRPGDIRKAMARAGLLRPRFRVALRKAFGQGDLFPGYEHPSPFKVSYELAFGKGTPWSFKHPEFASMSYPKQSKITKEVLDRVSDLVLHEIGAHGVQRIVGPGGWQRDQMAPSAQQDIHTDNPEIVRDFAAAIGLLAQQTEVFVSRPHKAGEKTALEIVEAPGSRKLANHYVVNRFWNDLIDLEPRLASGFLPIRHGDQHGIRVVNHPEYQDGTTWTPHDLPELEDAVKRTADNHGISLHVGQKALTKFIKVNSFSEGNDWKENPNGENYKLRLGGRLPSSVFGRLVDTHARSADAWLKDAIRRHGPGAPVRPRQEPGLGPGP